MQYDQFVGQVQHRAGLPSLGDAVAAIRATLTTLGERLTDEEVDHLAAQLPREIAAYLPWGAPYGPRRMTLDEFFERVSDREGVDLPDAVYHARVVGEVLRDAVSPGELEDVLAQLPEEYATLFEGAAGELPTRRHHRMRRGRFRHDSPNWR